MIGLQTDLWAAGFGKAGSAGAFGGLEGIGNGGILGKLGIIMLLGRLGLHGVWASGALLAVAFLAVVGLSYFVYRYRMRNV